MLSTAFREIGEVFKEYQITSIETDFVVKKTISIADFLRADLEFSLCVYPMCFDHHQHCLPELNLIHLKIPLSNLHDV